MRRQRYLQAGSFTDCLIDTYGTDEALVLYADRNLERSLGSSNFVKIYGMPLEELEGACLATPWREHLKLGILTTMGGLAALALVHLAISGPRAWIPAGVVGLMAFLV